MMKAAETHGGKMYLETQDGLDFTLRSLRNSFISTCRNSRPGDTKRALPEKLPWHLMAAETQCKDNTVARAG